MKGVQLAHVREITHAPYMFDIWHILPRDMGLVLRHVVGALMLIRRLQDDDRSTSSSEDEVLGVVPHHDSLIAHGSGG